MAKNDYKNVEKVKELLGEEHLGGLRKRLSATEKSLNDILKKLTVKDVLFDKLAQKACKSAIKSGDKLSDKEIEELIKLLKCDLGLKCPVGRPVAVKITRTEIDKWFKRII